MPIQPSSLWDQTTKPHIKAFAISLVLTLAVFLIGNSLLDKDIVLALCIFTNLLSFLGVHVWQNKGFGVVKRARALESTWVWPLSGQGLARLVTSLKKSLSYSEGDKGAKNGISSSLFALFMSLNYLVPFFMHATIACGHVLVIRSIGAGLCVGLLLKPYWPRWLKGYFRAYYYLTLVYCLPFTTTLFFLLERGNTEWLINIALGIMLLLVVLDWISFMVLAVLGVSLGLVAYKALIGPLGPTMAWEQVYSLSYTVIFSMLVGLTFARGKEQSFFKLELLGYTMNQEAEYALYSLNKLAYVIDAHVKDYLKQVQELKDQGAVEEEGWVKLKVKPHSVVHLNDLMFAMLSIIKQNEQGLGIVVDALKNKILSPELGVHAVKESVAKAIQECFFYQAPYLLQAALEEDFKANISPLHLEYVVLSILRYINAYPDRGVIKVKLSPGVIRIKAHGITLEASAASRLFSLQEDPQSSSVLGLGVCSLIMESMEGHIVCASHQGEGPYLSFELTLPVVV